VPGTPRGRVTRGQVERAAQDCQPDQDQTGNTPEPGAGAAHRPRQRRGETHPRPPPRATGTAATEAALADCAPEAALVGDAAVVRPVTGRLTSAAGPRWGRNHNGFDIANRIGTPIFAITDGVVVESGPASGFGLWVVLRHTDGTKSVDGHINRTFVDVGERVSAGEQIAEVGNRGYSTGPHLHLEIWDRDGSKLDPGSWFRRRGLDM
jgi:murein DD-endopeptidase MepM/ murein hydrolase activator NlpD